jgi:hypothetical protein
MTQRPVGPSARLPAPVKTKCSLISTEEFGAYGFRHFSQCQADHRILLAKLKVQLEMVSLKVLIVDDRESISIRAQFLFGGSIEANHVFGPRFAFN